MKTVLSKNENKKRKRDDPLEPITENPKKAKVHAQRKFAQGAAFNSPVITPIKDKVRPLNNASTPGPMLTSKCPNTEDFLTFLCFRRTSILPAKLDFFKDGFGSENDFPHDKSDSFNQKSGNESIKTKKVKTEDKNEEDKKTPTPAVQALRRKYKEQRLAKQKVAIVAKLAKKVKGKNMVRTRLSTAVEEMKTSKKKQNHGKENKTLCGLRSGLKRSPLPNNKGNKKESKPKHLRSGLRSGGAPPEPSTKGKLQIKPSPSVKTLVVKKPEKETKKLEVPEMKAKPKVKKPEGFSDFSSDDNEPLSAVKKPKLGGTNSMKVENKGKEKVKTRSQVESKIMRPTRKTKEAAALYVEMITRKLVSPEKSGEDDLSSVDSFPELPNAKRNEQRESEIKAKALATKKLEPKQEEKPSKDTRQTLSKKNESQNSKEDLIKKTVKKESKSDTKKEEKQGKRELSFPKRKSRGRKENPEKKKSEKKEGRKSGKKEEEEKKSGRKEEVEEEKKSGKKEEEKKSEKKEEEKKSGKKEEEKKSGKKEEERRSGKREEEKKTGKKDEEKKSGKKEEKKSGKKEEEEKKEPSRPSTRNRPIEEAEPVKKIPKAQKIKEEKKREKVKTDIKVSKDKVKQQVKIEVESGKKSMKENKNEIEKQEQKLTRHSGEKKKETKEMKEFSKEKEKPEILKDKGKQESSRGKKVESLKEKKLESPKEKKLETSKEKKSEISKEKKQEMSKEKKHELTKEKIQESAKEKKQESQESNQNFPKKRGRKPLKPQDLETQTKKLKVEEKDNCAVVVKKRPIRKCSTVDKIWFDMDAFTSDEDDFLDVSPIKAKSVMKKGRDKSEGKNKSDKAKIDETKPKESEEEPVNKRGRKKKIESHPEEENAKRTRPVRQCSTGEKRWIETDSDSFSFYESTDDELPIVGLGIKIDEPLVKPVEEEEEAAKGPASAVTVQMTQSVNTVQAVQTELIEQQDFSESDEEPLKKPLEIAEPEVKTRKELPALTPIKKSDIPQKPETHLPIIIPTEPKPLFYERKAEPNRIEMILHTLQEKPISFGNVTYPHTSTQIPCTYQVKATFPPTNEPISTHGLDLLSEVALPTSKINAQTERIEKWLNDSLGADRKKPYDDEYKNQQREEVYQSAAIKSSQTDYQKFGQELLESQKLLKRNLFEKTEPQKKVVTSVQDLLKLQKERRDVTKQTEKSPHLKNCKCNNCIVKKGWFKNKPVPKEQQKITDDSPKPFESLTKAFEGSKNSKTVSVAPMVVEKKGIFQRKLTFLERMKERERKEITKPSPNAFSPNNESSVYAFDEPESQNNLPFRRKSRTSSKSDESVKISEEEEKIKPSASIAVQVNLDNEAEPELEDGKSIEISTQTEVPEEDSDTPLFYIPLQQSKPGTSSTDQSLIQGVALKLGTEGPMGPNQRVVMKAKLVTKPPDIKAVVMPQPKRIFDQKNNNPPIGTVQPTTRKPPEEPGPKELKPKTEKKRPKPTVIKQTNTNLTAVTGAESKLVEAPIFHPTEKDFQDPFEFFDRIRPAAEKFGLCRIVPPSTFKPDCKVSDDMRFTAYNQYIHRMYYRWGPNIKEMMAIKKYLATQSISLKQPPCVGGIEVDLPRLYQSVQNCGGLMKVMEKKKWHQVADMMKIPKAAQDRVTKLDDIYCKYLLPYDTLSHDERQKLFDEVEDDWEERQKTVAESSEGEDDENYIEECEECIVKGKNMALNQFYRIARNNMSMWFRNPDPSPKEVETEFWKHVSERNHHVCVHSGSIDSSGWGYGFPIARNNTFSKHPWNLKVLTNNSGSVLRYLGPVMGVTVPTLHVGMVFTAFCWYRDPHGLPWIEYLHTGAPKIWYGISDDNSSVFHEALKKLLPRYIKNKTIWLPSDTAMIPPEVLVEHGVSLSYTVQEPGQFILVFPRAFTSSICTGYLVSESVYFAQLSWLTSAEQVFKDIQESCEPSMFSLEKLLFSIAMDTRSSMEVLKQVLPMVWHVRQKEIDGRKTLVNLGLKSTERLPARESGNKKKKGRWVQDDDGDYECEVCRTNLYVSLVTNSQEEGVYCLPHAIELLTQKRHHLKFCKLMYTYTQEEMNDIIEKLEQRIESKTQKKPQNKSLACGK